MDQVTLSSLSSLFENDKKPNISGLSSSGFSGSAGGDVCVVCGDRASGRHYGAISCEGCKGFFKRSIRKQLGYSCRGNKQCEVTKHHRNRCQFCRLQKCLSCGMRSDSVQHERKPLSNSQAQKRSESTEAALSPSSLYGSLLDGNSFTNRSGFLMYENSYQDDDESESANESDADRTSIAKAIERITSVINEAEELNEASSSSSPPILSQMDSVIPEDWFNFKVIAPSGPPTNGVLSSTYVCETGCRLLFVSIHWAKTLPVFEALNTDAQNNIMMSAWSDLFTIGLIQCQNLLPYTGVINAFLMNAPRNYPAWKFSRIADFAGTLKNVIKTLSDMGLSEFEFSYLKALAVFSPERHPYPGPAQNAVREIQEAALRQLQEYASQNYHEYQERVNHLLLVLTQIRSISGVVIEETFFSKVLGWASIQNVIPYIMKMKADLSFPTTEMDNNNDNSNDDDESMMVIHE